MASSGSPDGASAEKLDALVRDTGFFRSLVEHSSDAIVTIDETSTILYANASVERVLGYDPDDLIGEKLTVMMPERFHDVHMSAVEAYLRTGERQIDWNGVELPAVHSEGHEVPLSITFEEHTYEGTHMFSGIMRDISDRVEREQQLRQQNERLERFASIVSHDIKEPLQTARATASVARAGEEEAFDELFEIFDRMAELTDDVLTLARQGQTVGETEPVNLATVAEDAWSTVETTSATLVVDDDLPAMTADPERLRTLFENLFRNAIEHVGTGVTVRVGGLADGFYVADDGPGFGDTSPEQLFEAGYTTSEDGTGYGLRIVEEIASAHGWSLTATNPDGDGARFEIRDND
jgi:two-component system sensor kinase FixL